MEKEKYLYATVFSKRRPTCTMGQWTDGYSFIRNLNYRRLANAWDIYHSYRSSLRSRKAIVRGLPIGISIEPTTSCNLRCPECPSGLRAFTRPTGMLGEALFDEVLRQLGDTLVYLTFYFQGEPYLNPAFLPLVARARAQGIYTSTSTNAHYLTEETAKDTIASGLNRLIISIDGTTQDTYSSYRVGGSLEKVLEGTSRIVSWKKKMKSSTPHVVFQFLVLRTNEHQVDEIHALARKMGVDGVQIKTAQVYGYENGSDLIPENPKYSRYRKIREGVYSINNLLLDQCWRMWSGCVVTWDGKVVPCCFDKDAHHVLGDLGQQSFEAIWKGEPYQQFRSTLLRSRKDIDICRNCTEGMKIWAG